MKKIYLIRHGQTSYNNSGIVQGRGIDTSLNDKGRAQAAAFYESHKDIPFKKVYTSSLQRTVQSVDGFIKDGIPHEKLPGLDEISWGNSEGYKYSEKRNARYYEIIKEWSHGELDQKIEGGESPLDVQKRQRVAIDHILSQKNEDVVLVCMHGRAMRILLSWITGNHLKDMDTFEHDNLCLYILNYADSEFSVELYNDRTHLMDLESYDK